MGSIESGVDRPLILVADDVPENIDLLIDQLQALGFRTVTAKNATEALERCFETMPDLCILDIAMPAGDLPVADRTAGFELCRRIKKDPRTSRIPVIFVTALNETADRVKGIEAGGDDFLTKPHNRLVLSARVKSLLRLKAVTDALEVSYKKLRELEKVRDDLMRMIVHDLKIPLTSVLATLEMVVDGDFGPIQGQQREMLNEAHGKADELLALIGDLLEVVNVEETGMSLNCESIMPHDLINELVNEWRVRFEQEGTNVITLINADTPHFVGDRQLLKRVFANLIQNAITHSGRPIDLHITVRALEDAVLFSVEDNGNGIPPEFHEMIFQKFGTVKSTNTPRVRSSGLGLTFCRMVAEAHGGRIWLKSAPGEGSAFYLQIPNNLPQI